MDFNEKDNDHYYARCSCCDFCRVDFEHINDQRRLTLDKETDMYICSVCVDESVEEVLDKDDEPGYTMGIVPPSRNIRKVVDEPRTCTIFEGYTQKELDDWIEEYSASLKS